MMDTRQLRERFVKLGWQQQMGNLASTLARVSSQAASPEYDGLVSNLLQEAALFVEWGAPQSPPACLPELAALQKEILAWKRLWPLPKARPLLSLYARNRSDWLLQMAGLT
jgi:hypothetical protein